MAPDIAPIKNAAAPRISPDWPTAMMLAAPLVVAILSIHHANRDFQIGMDYRMTYTAARAWLNGADPYDDAVLKEIWADAGMPHATPPGLPQTPNVYPLTIAPVLAPLAALSFPASLALWLMINGGAAGLLGASIIRPRRKAESADETSATQLASHCRPASARWWSFLALAALVFGFPLRYGLSFGNLVILTTAFTVASVRWRHRPAFAGILLGLALVKYTLSAPVAFVFLLERRWKLLITACAVQTLLLMTATLGYAGDSRTGWIAEMMDAGVASMAPGAVNDHAALSYTSLHLDLSALLFRLSPALADVRFIFIAGMGVLTLWACRPLKADRRDESAFAELRYVVVLSAGMLAVYHRVYDAVIVIAPLATWLVMYRAQLPGHIRNVLWTGLILTMFAGGTIAGGRPDVPYAVLAFAQPVCTWAILVVLTGGVAGLASLRRRATTVQTG